jgi:aminoglycoside phosphotransferase (APT) family kinase protein
VINIKNTKMIGEAFVSAVSRLYGGATVESTTRLMGGVSADVFKLVVRKANGERASIVLRVHGETHSGHPAALEFNLLRALYAQGVAVPEPLLLDDSCKLLPYPFLLMAFMAGSTLIPSGGENAYIEKLASTLVDIHNLATSELPALPIRTNPIPEVFDYLPTGASWQPLHDRLKALTNTDYSGQHKLLHGDYWPENILWKHGHPVAILDWEDAALGDPLADVAAARVELRYKFGTAAMTRFTEAYAKGAAVDYQRLMLWQVYVAAAAQCFMRQWGLPPEQEAHMRKEALASIQEAGDWLGQTNKS